MGKLGFTTVALVGMVSLAQAGAPAPKAPAAKANPAAELKTLATKMLDAWSSGDREAFKNGLADNMWGGAWDLDMAGRPAAWATQAEVLKMYDEMVDGMKKAGGQMTMKLTKLECKAGGNLGVCISEVDVTATMPGMPPFSGGARATQVFEKGAKGWKAIHHHGSVSRAPELPPKSIMVNLKTAKWMDAPMPDMPGLKVVPLWVNPITQSMAMVLKATKDIKQARHLHPYAMTLSVLAGTLVTSDENGKDKNYGPGSVIYRAANEIHTTTIKTGATVFAVADGPMVNVMVDDSGNPIAK